MHNSLTKPYDGLLWKLSSAPGEPSGSKRNLRVNSRFDEVQDALLLAVERSHVTVLDQSKGFN